MKNTTIKFPEYNNLQKKFIENGYVITKVENFQLLEKLKKHVQIKVNKSLKKEINLKNIHKFIKIKNINSVRMKIANDFRKDQWIRPLFYQIGKHKLNYLVGSELSMQNKAILSIQMPKDDTSVLPIHCDVFSGESPFQINQWVPLVDSSKSMSMFFLPKKFSLEVFKNFNKFRKEGLQKILSDFKKDIIWLDVPYGKQVFFCSNFFHGNVTNNEDSTRWSFNIRYVNLLKSLSSDEKSLFNFYEPISQKPSTKLAMDFNNIKFDKLNITPEFKKVTPTKIKQLQTYVSSRKFGNWRLPVPMQNIILKDYCDKNNYIFNVSMNELNIRSSLTILNTILKNLKNDQGILMCSYKMIASDQKKSLKIISEGLKFGVEWHFAFENTKISNIEDLKKFSQMIELNNESMSNKHV